MSEPRLEDDTAAGIDPFCDDCERWHDTSLECDFDNDEPDIMWQDFFED